MVVVVYGGLARGFIAQGGARASTRWSDKVPGVAFVVAVEIFFASLRLAVGC